MDTALYTTPRTGGARRDVAYHQLKLRLLEGAFPLGARLVEERLGAELEMSRTPVREALSRLDAEGLVERHPDGGFRPVVPRLEPIVELYEVRRALEREALLRPRTTGARHDAGAVADLADRWRAWAASPPAPDPAFVAEDEAFHVTLARAAGNSELAGVLVAVNERIRLVRSYDFITADRIEGTIADHVRIAEAVGGGDLERAVAAFDDHLARSMAVVAERVERVQARMASALGAAT